MCSTILRNILNLGTIQSKQRCSLSDTSLNYNFLTMALFLRIVKHLSTQHIFNVNKNDLCS